MADNHDIIDPRIGRLIFLLFMSIQIELCHAAESEWQLSGQRDIYRIVLIKPNAKSTTNVYWDAIKKICGKGYCNLAFFSEDNLIASVGQGRLTQDDIDQALLIYSGQKGFAWNCQFKPDADNCFR